MLLTDLKGVSVRAEPVSVRLKVFMVCDPVTLPVPVKKVFFVMRFKVDVPFMASPVYEPDALSIQ